MQHEQEELHFKQGRRHDNHDDDDYDSVQGGRLHGNAKGRTASRQRRKAGRATSRGASSCSRTRLVLGAVALLLMQMQHLVLLPPSYGRQRQHTVPGAVLAFSPTMIFARSRSLSSVVALRMGRKKGSGGKLGNMVDLDESESSPTAASAAPQAKQASKVRRSVAKTATASSSAKKTTPGGISPLLAQWAADKSPTNSRDDDERANDGNEAAVIAPPPTREASDNSRRQRQSQRKELEKERDEIVRQVVDSIEAMLSDNDDDDDDNNKKKKKEPFKVETLLARIRELLELNSNEFGSSDLRQLTAGSTSTDYRLAWVGSDEAMCHLGTGLHKVKLARLQEVFLTLGPKSRVQMYEVIRILGPFPNVKNTLVGKSAVDKPRSGGGRAQGSAGGQPWKITWQSLIDGTGKEILAGSQVRNVDLEVLWCDASLLLCAAARAADNASTGRSTKDLLHDDGRDLFVFVREGKMESKLDALRVI